MATDFLDEVNFSKKKADEFAVKGKKPRFQTTQEAFSYLVEKERQKKIKFEATKKLKGIQRQAKLKQAFGRLAPIAESLQQAQAQQIQGQRREGFIRQIGSKAERIENQMLSINEVPFLRNMESARARVLSPPNQWLRDVERQATMEMPD